MIEIYKLEDYKAHTINSEVFSFVTKPKEPLKYTFIHSYGRGHNIIAPIPKTVHLKLSNNGIDGKIDIKNEIKLRSGDSIGPKLYLHPNCIIPRAKVTQKYTRTIKASSADNCVIPEIHKYINTRRAAIFINRAKNKIYYCPAKGVWSNSRINMVEPFLCQNYNIGTPLLTIYPLLKDTTLASSSYYYGNFQEAQETWSDFLASTLVFYGHCADLETKEEWIADLLYNKLHDVVEEQTILATLGNEEGKFDKEIFDNIKQMLESTDSTVVGIGLKTLAELDYEKYKNTAILLLCSSKGNRWLRNEMKNSASVKYMLKFLNLWNNNIEHYSTTINNDDFNLLQEAVLASFKEDLNALTSHLLRRFPFVDVTFNYDVAVAPRTIEWTKEESNEDNTNSFNEE